MTTTTKSNTPQFSKWHLVIILGIGTSVALGFAYWYYKKKNSENSKKLCDDVYENTEAKPLPKELKNIILKKNEILKNPNLC
ncbi:mitochondrial import receptor subunit TOM70 [Trichonephila inaurata madagascariensis]|uniref:Mitochondrial import receptor subunit TOM70 n=1 Tax=Trichonephila inaurata madagascariensis TaxID=2747483 RepID=A0A8X6IAE8_9ARAC|nr:mitochondrial import receptor subunit TOM70 [Trichonephila inaurata madagascariensis]